MAGSNAERAPPDQLELFLDEEDDGSFEAFVRLMHDPDQNPQLRGDHPSPDSRQSRSNTASGNESTRSSTSERSSEQRTRGSSAG